MLTHQDFLDECAKGMAEHKAKAEERALSCHPYLRRPHVTLAEFDAKRMARA
jgi:hypothetical protein